METSARVYVSTSSPIYRRADRGDTLTYDAFNRGAALAAPRKQDTTVEGEYWRLREPAG